MRSGFLSEKKNVIVVQRYWINELGTPPPTWVTVALLYDTFEIQQWKMSRRVMLEDLTVP